MDGSEGHTDLRMSMPGNVGAFYRGSTKPDGSALCLGKKDCCTSRSDMCATMSETKTNYNPIFCKKQFTAAADDAHNACDHIAAFPINICCSVLMYANFLLVT